METPTLSKARHRNVGGPVLFGVLTLVVAVTVALVLVHSGYREKGTVRTAAATSPSTVLPASAALPTEESALAIVRGLGGLVHNPTSYRAILTNWSGLESLAVSDRHSSESVVPATDPVWTVAVTGEIKAQFGLEATLPYSWAIYTYVAITGLGVSSEEGRGSLPDWLGRLPPAVSRS